MSRVTGRSEVWRTEPVVEIGRNAFRNCDRLTSVEFPASLIKIDQYAFENCHALTAVKLPANLEHIGRAAFQGCDSISEITIPASAKVMLEDVGLHTVCAVVAAGFLDFSKSRGNDLTTPRPDYGFPGQKPGDKWCLCVRRWAEAFDAGMAPNVCLEATHISALEFVDLENLKQHAAE